MCNRFAPLVRSFPTSSPLVLPRPRRLSAARLPAQLGLVVVGRRMRLGAWELPALGSWPQRRLRDHPGLREHNAQRRKRRLDETLSKNENATDYVEQLLKSDPTLASALGIGGNIVSKTGPVSDPITYLGKKFPTYFRIIKEPAGGLTKLCALNRTVRVEFETDADNDYFNRIDCPGAIELDPPNLCVSSHLWDGKFTTKFQMPYDAEVGDVVNVMVTVTDIETASVAAISAGDLGEHPRATVREMDATAIDANVKVAATSRIVCPFFLPNRWCGEVSPFGLPLTLATRNTRRAIRTAGGLPPTRH